MKWILSVVLALMPIDLSAQAITRLASQTTVGTMTTSGNTIAFGPIGTLGFASLGVEARGSWTGTVAIECAAGAGTFVALVLSPRSGAAPVTSFTANGQWSAPIGGCQRVQAHATAAMTGTVTITMAGAFQ